MRARGEREKEVGEEIDRGGVGEERERRDREREERERGEIGRERREIERRETETH